MGRAGWQDDEIAELDQTAEQISQAERRAMAAERETVDRLIATHLSAQVGASFSGRISGVTRSGLFVKLDGNGADGFIPASTVGRDYYVYSEGDHALIGERTGETYRLGDKVEVKLVEAHPSAGALRFQLLSDGRFDLKLARRKRGPTGAKNAPAQALNKASRSGDSSTHPFDFRPFGTIFWACIEIKSKIAADGRDAQAEARRLSGDASRRAAALPRMRRRAAFPGAI